MTSLKIFFLIHVDSSCRWMCPAHCCGLFLSSADTLIQKIKNKALASESWLFSFRLRLLLFLTASGIEHWNRLSASSFILLFYFHFCVILMKWQIFYVWKNNSKKQQQTRARILIILVNLINVVFWGLLALQI